MMLYPWFQGILKFTSDDETQVISSKFAERPIIEKSEFKTFEVLKNLHKKCDVSPMLVSLPFKLLNFNLASLREFPKIIF